MENSKLTDVNSTISAITLNVNELNTPIISRNCQTAKKKKIQLKRHTLKSKAQIG